MSVYQTYVNAMNDKIKKQISISNPFVFKHISNLKVGDTFLSYNFKPWECDKAIVNDQ